MDNYNKIVTLATTLTEQTEAYANRSTKAESARIRKTLVEIKKLVTKARAELVEADKW